MISFLHMFSTYLYNSVYIKFLFYMNMNVFFSLTYADVRLPMSHLYHTPYYSKYNDTRPY